MAGQDRIVAVGLLTANDLACLGQGFHRIWPIEAAPHFDELLRAIDVADMELRIEQTNTGSAGPSRR